MGSADRTSRVQKFVDAFGEDYLKRVAIPAGTRLTVQDVKLDEDFDMDSVAIGYTLTSSDGVRHEVKSPTTLYDADYSSKDELITQLCDDLDLSAEDAAKRIEKAGLFD